MKSKAKQNKTKRDVPFIRSLSEQCSVKTRRGRFGPTQTCSLRKKRMGELPNRPVRRKFAAPAKRGHITCVQNMTHETIVLWRQLTSVCEITAVRKSSSGRFDHSTNDFNNNCVCKPLSNYCTVGSHKRQHAYGTVRRQPTTRSPWLYSTLV